MHVVIHNNVTTNRTAAYKNITEPIKLLLAEGVKRPFSISPTMGSRLIAKLNSQTPTDYAA